MINKILTGTFFKGVLVINAIMVLLPVFFLLNSSLRETGSFSANPIELARDPQWIISRKCGQMVNFQFS